MAMICREILKLPSMQDVRVIAGSEGMDKPVRWIYVAECFEDTRQVVDWLYGGELVFITGLGIKGNTDLLVELVEKINTKKVSGLIINVGPYIPVIPEKVIELADRLSLPIFELPWETKLVEITRDICSAIILKEKEEMSIENLLEYVLFSDIRGDESLKDRIKYYGFEQKGSFRVGIADFDNFAVHLKSKGLKDEKAVMDLKVTLKRIVQEVMYNHSKKSLMLLRSDSVVFLTQVQEDGTKELNRIIDEIRKSVQKKLSGLTVSIGIGNAYSELTDIRKSFKEAEFALTVAKQSNAKNGVCYYKALGLYSLLFEIKDQQVLGRFYQDVLGSIIEYDKVNSNNLISTLEMYLQESGNITTTSEKLFIHRNTLKYRIQKIEEITGLDLKDLQDCIRLQIALMIGQLISNHH
ncbi:MAG: PucR family transcriptional regulator ligand-binding domain-containing protein [Clostridia bacterium]|nr:PucR family transcriptional regulator ligand-binding domain-containing protein [Clostridia bacterium]